MKFQSNAIIAGSPQFQLQVKSNPLAFAVDGEGSLKIATGPITAQVAEIPIAVTIPFLRRGGGVVAAVALGPFGVRLEPIEASVQAFGVRVGGVLGKDGMECNLNGTVTCKMELDVSGDIPLKVVKAGFEGALGE